MKYNLISIVIIISFFGCKKNNKIDMIVYPEYCGGCVTNNFFSIKNNNSFDRFNIYFDSTDIFILKEARKNGLSFIHIDKEKIPAKFGDYANVVLIKPNGEVIELKTNEVIEKGKHF